MPFGRSVNAIEVPEEGKGAMVVFIFPHLLHFGVRSVSSKLLSGG